DYYGRVVEWRGETSTRAMNQEGPFRWRPDDLAYIFFTSGSTGEPKGIAGRYESIWHFIQWEISTLGLGAGCRVSQLTSPSFDAIMPDLFLPLATGGCICIPPEPLAVADTKQLVEWISTSQVQVMHCVPSVFRRMLGAPLVREAFASLKYVLLAGEPLLPA